MPALQAAVPDETLPQHPESEEEAPAALDPALQAELPLDPVQAAADLGADWVAKFQQLKEFKATFGDCLVPT